MMWGGTGGAMSLMAGMVAGVGVWGGAHLVVFPRKRE